MQDPSLGVHGYAHLEDVRLHYVTNGSEDKPLLLLVHGFPEFWYSWRYQLKEFHDNYRVVAVDQRGYGDSDKPNGVHNYTVATLVSDLRELVTTLGCKKCTVVGHDWGGIIAWAFAQTTPDMVERLIILNCPSSAAYVKHCSNGLSQLKKSWYMTLFQVPRVPELFLSTEDYAALTLFHSKTYGSNGFTAPLNYYRALLRYPQFAFIRLQSPQLRVTCPTLIIWGCNDAALDKELAALSAETVEGDVTVKYIEDCSHWTQMDRPEEVNKYMREFLEKTEKKTICCE
ncbi:hypothetical protein C0Q70_04619 [Pomacea canaliculata]|uniref:AB hydrolase-1 domain-containing protein n=1 Tax=Pomacea canaliculata TaxID=400727 RepID=A0A2T7PIW2_POMCA|nr:hypothetical protein C0Q70_04619 [Pomacea canaliculata]